MMDIRSVQREKTPENNCLSAESTIASLRWKFLEKITVSQNKLCSIFVVSDTKELSEIRQSWR